MAQLIQRFRPFEVPTNFSFVDPDTGRHYFATTKAELVKQIVSYREQNRLEPIEELEIVLEGYWCSLPENLGKCQSMPLRRGWFQTLKGGVALLENVFYGEKNMVDDAEAERRAQICVTCPFNIFPDKTGFIRWADRLAEASTDGRKTPSHDKLGNCEVCSCNLRAKVFSKPPFKFSEDEREKLPDFCWGKNL